MRTRVVALLASFSLLGCFPHNARHRTYAKLGEGGAIVAGIVLEALVNSGADCDQMAGTATGSTSCHDKATLLGDVGVGLILGGLLGFVATISTEDEGRAPPPVVEIKADRATNPKLALPPGVKPGTPAPVAAPAGSDSGSGAAPAAAGSGDGSAS